MDPIAKGKSPNITGAFPGNSRLNSIAKTASTFLPSRDPDAGDEHSSVGNAASRVSESLKGGLMSNTSDSDLAAGTIPVEPRTGLPQWAKTLPKG